MNNVIPFRPRDSRVVYSMRGTWWDSIANVSTRNGLPCCPHCGSMLFEMENEEKWWEGARSYEADGHPGYVAMIEWARGKHFPNMAALEASYQLTMQMERGDD